MKAGQSLEIAPQNPLLDDEDYGNDKFETYHDGAENTSIGSRSTGLKKKNSIEQKLLGVDISKLNVQIAENFIGPN